MENNGQLTLQEQNDKVINILANKVGILEADKVILAVEIERLNNILQSISKKDEEK